MKNASLILNGVLLVAVVVLYILHFSSGKSSAGSAGSAGPSNLKVAYINEDTVLKYYDYFKINRDQLEAKLEQAKQQVTARQSALQREVQNYQANAGNMTRNQMAAIEEDLQKKGQNLQMFQESLAVQMEQEQGRVSEDIYKRLTDYLKGYTKQTGIEVILKSNRGSDLLYASDSLDVSKDVVKGLNDAYTAEKANPKTPAKKDSVK